MLCTVCSRCFRVRKAAALNSVLSMALWCLVAENHDVYIIIYLNHTGQIPRTSVGLNLGETIKITQNGCEEKGLVCSNHVLDVVCAIRSRTNVPVVIQAT